MNTWIGQNAEQTLNDERTLDDVRHEFPSWTCWERNGLCYARRPHAPHGDYDAHGDDPADLREAILLALARDAALAMPAPGSASTLADVQREHPDWACWQSTGGLLYARRRSAPPGRPDVWGHDPPSLREAITRFQPAQDHDTQAWTPARDTL